MVLLSSIVPTVMTSELIPGESMELANDPQFLAATTTTNPLLTALVTVLHIGFFEQGLLAGLPREDL